MAGPLIPILTSVVSALFGGKQKPEEKKMVFNGANRAAQPVQGQMGQQSTPIGQVTGQQMPPQQQPATGQGNGLQNGMNKVSTIANILQSLKGSSGGGQNQSYQMQMRRR